MDQSWAKKFVLGHVLFHYTPPAEVPTASEDVHSPQDRQSQPRSVASSSSASPTPSPTEHIALQRQLSDQWRLPVKALDAPSSTAILKLLGRYCVGQSSLSIEALDVLDEALRALGHPGSVEDPAQMRLLLERIGFVEPKDNLLRQVFRGELFYDHSATSVMGDHLDVPRDLYDRYRNTTSHNVYAIDSATTSEVDDAIGVHVDDQGREWFTVYVSDATVHCPFDSALERLTARSLTTTHYLPEGVYFMLPKPIVEAATLREDRPCRTFEIVFRINSDTGAVEDYSIGVGWVTQLRRITYDAVQELYDAGGNASPQPQTPAWCRKEDIRRLHRIHEIAKLRLAARMRMAKNHFESNLPDPLITVRGTDVVSVKDQILGTKDARLAVAELMIAANEVCSRIAQRAGVCIPFRGTRVLSRDHVAAVSFTEPSGTVILQTAAGEEQQRTPAPVGGESGASSSYAAQAIFRSIAALSGVTRAIYHYEPILHTGLETTFYSHSTSPLRRYADMLLHHQLKLWIAQQHGATGGGGILFEEYIPSFQMASLCSMISTKQEQGALLQDLSSRYWLLSYIWSNLLKEGKEQSTRLLRAFVGITRDVSAAPDYGRWDNAIQQQASHLTSPQQQQSRYISDVYLPELQMTEVIVHNRPDVRVGTTVSCRVRAIHPMQDILQLEVVAVEPTESMEDEMKKYLWVSADM